MALLVKHKIELAIKFITKTDLHSLLPNAHQHVMVQHAPYCYKINLFIFFIGKKVVYNYYVQTALKYILIVECLNGMHNLTYNFFFCDESI